MAQLKQFTVEITNACNSKCPFCPNRLSTRPITHMSVELYTKLVREVRELGFATPESCMGICGIGEPLCHPQFPEFMRIPHELGVAYGIGTNGHLLPKFVDPIIKYDPQEVCLSVDACTAAVHGKLRPGVKFSNVKRGVAEYMRRVAAGDANPYKLWVQIVVTTENVHQTQRFCEEWLPFVEAIPNARLFVKCVCPWPYHEANLYHPAPTPVLSEDVVSHPQVVVATFDPPLKFQATCGLFDLFGQVLSDGSYVPCCMPTRDYWGIGNVETMTLTECFHSPKMEALRRLPKTNVPFCKDCI